MDKADIIDLRGIARLLKVSPHTPNQWRQRGLLPEPDPEFAVLARPLWRVETIQRWAESTGRWPPGSAARPYPAHVRPKKTLRAQVETPAPQSDDQSGFRTAEDVKAAIPQVMFRPPAEAA